ncbi:hypothetical protein EDF77_2022 [Stenotrophomonas maltophilia]|nr:hypothetical protein [Stenotrophomonas chelatiphaga]ROQ42545.1 hypothetical protein EDF77_2022 [Stenotrophomonas maltophilia]
MQFLPSPDQPHRPAQPRMDLPQTATREGVSPVRQLTHHLNSTRLNARVIMPATSP